MSTKTITKCDVCGKETESDRRTEWAHFSVSSGFYGPHPFLSGPHAHQHDSVSKDADVCSADCALKWLRTRIEKTEANAKEWAEWNAGERKRAEDQARWSRENDERFKREQEEKRKAKEAADKEQAERNAWVDQQRSGTRRFE